MTFKHFLMIIGFSILVSNIDAKEMTMSEQIFSSYLSQAAIPNMSKGLPRTTPQEALHVQQEYLRLRNPLDPIAGFDLELTTIDAYEKLNLPRGGVLLDALFQAEALQTPAQLSLHNSNPFFQQSLETKFGFYLKRSLNHQLTHPQELQALVEYVTPVVEMTHFYYVSAPSTVDLIAGNGGYRAWIVGNKIPIEQLDLNGIDVVLRYNNSPLYSGKGSDSMGDQWQALMTLINRAIELGWTLEPNQVLVTGQIGKNLAPQPGLYRVEFGALGNIELNISN